MANTDVLIKEIETLPPSFIDEVYNFVLYLKHKAIRLKIEDITLASEYVLSKDWHLPEEDDTWENL